MPLLFDEPLEAMCNALAFAESVALTCPATGADATADAAAAHALCVSDLQDLYGLAETQSDKEIWGCWPTAVTPGPDSSDDATPTLTLDE